MAIDPLVVDLYVGDEFGEPRIWQVVQAGRPWVGLCFKASEGLYYPNNKAADAAYRDWWLSAYWNLTKWLARKRLGVDFFVQQYHYARIDQDPVKQAQWNTQVIKNVGGYYKGCMAPMVDVESAENPDKPGAAAIETWLQKFSAEMFRLVGIRPILYGNMYLAENNVDFQKCDCLSLEVAHYASTLPSTVYTRINCPLAQLSGWQYIGTYNPPTPVPKGYPVYSPLSSTQTEDITAYVINDTQGFDAVLSWMRSHCIPGV